MTTSPVPPFAVQAGEGTRWWTPTGEGILKADTAMTNGSMSVLQLEIRPMEGPGLHAHDREDELWYVLEGEFRFKAGGVMLHASTGGMAFGPRGTPHCFQNIGETSGRLLIVTSPSGVERFFEDLAELAPGPVGPEAFAAVGQPHGVEFVGPPLQVSDPL